MYKSLVFSQSYRIGTREYRRIGYRRHSHWHGHLVTAHLAIANCVAKLGVISTISICCRHKLKLTRLEICLADDLALGHCHPVAIAVLIQQLTRPRQFSNGYGRQLRVDINKTKLIDAKDMLAIFQQHWRCGVNHGRCFVDIGHRHSNRLVSALGWRTIVGHGCGELIDVIAICICGGFKIWCGLKAYYASIGIKRKRIDIVTTGQREQQGICSILITAG